MSELKEATAYENIEPDDVRALVVELNISTGYRRYLHFALDLARARIKLAKEVESGERVACRFAAVSATGGHTIIGYQDHTDEELLAELKTNWVDCSRVELLGTVYLPKPVLAEEVEGETDAQE